jgi:hypothetical protein
MDGDRAKRFVHHSFLLSQSVSRKFLFSFCFTSKRSVLHYCNNWLYLLRKRKPVLNSLPLSKKMYWTPSYFILFIFSRENDVEVLFLKVYFNETVTFRCTSSLGQAQLCCSWVLRRSIRPTVQCVVFFVVLYEYNDSLICGWKKKKDLWVAGQLYNGLKVLSYSKL